MRESLLIRAGEEGGIRVLYRSKVGTPFSHVPGLRGFQLLPNITDIVGLRVLVSMICTCIARCCTSARTLGMSSDRRKQPGWTTTHLSASLRLCRLNCSIGSPYHAFVTLQHSVAPRNIHSLSSGQGYPALLPPRVCVRTHPSFRYLWNRSSACPPLHRDCPVKTYGANERARGTEASPKESLRIVK